MTALDGSLNQLIDKPRLADTGLPREHDQPTTLTPSEQIEPRDHPVDLGSSAHEDRTAHGTIVRDLPRLDFTQSPATRATPRVEVGTADVPQMSDLSLRRPALCRQAARPRKLEMVEQVPAASVLSELITQRADLGR